MGFFTTGMGSGGAKSYKGGYDNAKKYYVGETVSSQGTIYICLKATIGNLTSNTTYWDVYQAAGAASVAIDDSNPNTASTTLSALAIKSELDAKINDSNSSSTTTSYSASKIESKLNNKSKVTDSVSNGNLVVDGSEVVVYDDTTLKNASHTHTNKSTLDKLTDNGTNIFFNGSPIVSGGASEPEYVVNDAWNTSGTRTISGSNYKFYIHNTGNADLTFTINSIVFTVKPTEEFEDIFDVFTQVIVTATSTFDANVSGLKSGSSLPTYSVKDYFSASANTTRSFSGSVYGIVISNDGVSALTYTVNGITMTVEAGDVVEKYFNTLTQVTVTSTVAFRAYAKSTLGTAVTGSTGADVTPPNNVTNITASSVTATTLTLSWTASTSTDIASYDIYNGATLLGNTVSTNYNVTGLTEKTQYTFTVKAKDTSSNVASGASVTITTADVTAPTNVTNLTTASVTQTALTLNWSASVSSDVSSYDVYNGATLLGNVTATTYNVTSLTSGTAYTFWVKAKDASNNIASGTSVGITTSTTITIPNDVTGLNTSLVTSTSLTVGWTASSGATSYDIYNGATLLGNTASTSYNVTGLTASTQYTFKVIAKNTAGSSTGVTTTATTASASSWVTTGLVNKWDGLTSQVSVNNDGSYYPATGEFTLCTTLKSKAYLNIFSQFLVGSPSTSTAKFTLDSTGQMPLLNTWGTSGGSGSNPGTSGGASVLTNATLYYHVVLTRDNTTHKFNIYVNNTLYQSTLAFPTDFAFNANITPPAEPLKIADAASDILHTLYYNRLLTSTELTQNYNNLMT